MLIVDSGHRSDILALSANVHSLWTQRQPLSFASSVTGYPQFDCFLQCAVASTFVVNVFPLLSCTPALGTFMPIVQSVTHAPCVSPSSRSSLHRVTTVARYGSISPFHVLGRTNLRTIPTASTSCRLVFSSPITGDWTGSTHFCTFRASTPPSSDVFP